MCTETMFRDKKHLVQFPLTGRDFREICGERVGGTHFWGRDTEQLV
jgi:hypothetical protein